MIDGANPQGGGFLMKICPADKARRRRGLNFKEDSEFRGVCKYGSAALLECYDYLDEDLSVYDFKQLCSKCPHRLASIWTSMISGTCFDPCAILDLLDEHISDDDDMDKDFVYFVSDGEYIKIGRAADPYRRVRKLQTSSPRELKILALIPCKSKGDGIKAEGKLHCLYQDYHVRGEWYNLVRELNRPFFDTLIQIFGPPEDLDDNPEEERRRT